MPLSKLHQAPFLFESFYHLYNRSVKGQLLFYSDENYRYFLQAFDEYLSDFFKVYAWNLIPNHFHFVVSVKSESECLFTEKEKQYLMIHPFDINFLISRRCKNFFIAYSLALKRQRKINTNIFAQHYKHIEIEKDAYFSQLICYIHYNPLHHGLTNDWENYPWSSYSRIIREVKSHLETKYVLDWFGGKDAFIAYHKLQAPMYQCDFDER